MKGLKNVNLYQITPPPLKVKWPSLIVLLQLGNERVCSSKAKLVLRYVELVLNKDEQHSLIAKKLNFFRCYLL